MWLRIVNTANVIMALSDRRNNLKWLMPYSFTLRGVLFVINQIAFCNRENFRMLPISLNK